MATRRVKPLVVFRKPKGCSVPIPPATVGVLIIEYRADGRRVASSTGIRVRYDKWNAEARRIRGNSEAVDNDNELLTSLYDEANAACIALRKAKLPAVPARAKAIAASDGQLEADEPLLRSWAAWHERQLERAAAGEILPVTARLPERRKPLLLAWLKAEGLSGLLTKDLSAARCRDFARWLLTHYPTVTKQSFANKCARLLYECAACAVERRVLAHHPIGKLKLAKVKKKPLSFLSLAQLDELRAARFTSPAHRRTRDAFLLICYTGFAHVDARAFDPARHIRTDREGVRWVIRPRQKSDEEAYVALLPEAERLLEKYAHEGRVPVASNQKMNERLHEIEALLDLPLSLTCHVGRRTCGMLLLDAGLSMEAVSKWLGHSSIKMTETLYSHVQQRRIGRELREAGLLLPA